MIYGVLFPHSNPGCRFSSLICKWKYEMDFTEYKALLSTSNVVCLKLPFAHFFLCYFLILSYCLIKGSLLFAPPVFTLSLRGSHLSSDKLCDFILFF